MFIFKEMDWDVSLKIFAEYIVPFLFVKAFVDCCSFDTVGEIVFDASFNEFQLKRCSGSA